MAEAGQEKSRGLKFAERQLLRHGWEHGKGLGRDENGISEAIKVKVKCDKGGVGHKEGDQFTFHWWDHVFNQTSSSLQVESDHDGLKVRKNTGEDEGGISNKKPLKASLAKDKLYGAFVKSATLVSGQEQSVENTSSDSSSSDEDETKLDLSTTTKLSDAQLIKACGGRTAHKGARHGLKMSAKLARLEQQEAEFMAKYGKKTQPETDSNVNGEAEDNTALVNSKKKKKKKSKDCESPENATFMDSVGNRQDETKVKPKKKKKNKSSVEEEIQVELKVKRKKSSKDLEENGTVLMQNGHDVTLQDTQESAPPKKKKKKKSKE